MGKYYLRCKKIHKKCSKDWYDNNQDKIKKYKNLNKEKYKEYYKQYYITNLEKVKQYNESRKEKVKAIKQIYRKNNREKWYKFLTEINMGFCRECKYAKTMAAIEYHHTDESQKEFSISQFIQKPFSEENTQILSKELEKCVPLCANCHRELHARRDQC
jgi:hypothetical protein